MPMDAEQQFAESLMRQVRDRAIDACDRLVSGGMGSVRARQWQATLRDSDACSALSALIPDIVDQVLFELLDRADNNELRLAWRDSNGQWVPLSELGGGEMAGWLMMGEGGWIDSFSEKRFNDYLANVHLPPKNDDGNAET